MNRPLIVAGAVFLVAGMVMMILGIALGVIGASNQEYEVIEDEDAFSNTGGGTYTHTISTSNLQKLRIEVRSKGPSALVFDIGITISGSEILLNERNKITPYSVDIDVTDFAMYTISIGFDDGTVERSEFSITISEMTLSDSAIGACCAGLLLPILGVLSLLTGAVMLVVGLLIGKKEGTDHNWARPQGTDRFQGPYVEPDRTRCDSCNIPSARTDSVSPSGNEGTFSPGILEPPPRHGQSGMQ